MKKGHGRVRSRLRGVEHRRSEWSSGADRKRYLTQRDGQNSLHNCLNLSLHEDKTIVQVLREPMTRNSEGHSRGTYLISEF